MLNLTKSKSAPEKAKALIEKLELKQAEANDKLEKVQKLYGQALLAVEESEDAKAKQKLELSTRDLRHAKTAVFDSGAALEAARSKHAEVLKKAERAEIERLWDESEKLGDKRELLARKLQKTMEEFSKDLAELVVLSEKQYHLAPGKKETAFGSSTFSPAFIVNTTKQNLFKRGCDWAFNKWPWSKEEIPDLTERVAEANAWLVKHRNRMKRRCCI
jgi:multidrug efflux pump subunit AcrA (membrane-fusion protein)